MKILIIDDSLVMRRIHKNSLVEHKVPEDSFLEAEDGDKALSIAKKEPIDIFLVDWNMPKISGFEFVKIMRKMEQYKDTPMIMITSEAAKYNVMDAVIAGVTSYIVKPIKGEMLWEKISQYFETGGSK